MSNLNETMSNLDASMSNLRIKFNKKAWLKQYFKKKAACPRCGSVVVSHKMKRHQTSAKCISGHAEDS